VFKALDELRITLEAQWTEHEKLEQAGTLSPSVFHRDGQPIKSYRRAWLTACKRAGCPGRIPHEFRRTAVRNLVRAGVPDVVAMKMTEHKTRSVFDRYDIVSESDLTEAGEKLNRLTGQFQGQRAHYRRPARSKSSERLRNLVPRGRIELPTP